MRNQRPLPLNFDDQPVFPRDARITRIIFVTGIIYFGIFFFIFRDIISYLPELMNGEMVINGDELVPFFNPHSQFFDQVAGEFNDLTNGYEFRVRYSIISTWMRYYKILPFALLLVIPSITFLSYLAVSYFLQRVMPLVEKTSLFRAPIAPTLLIYLILSYTKIAHFYTLILGFGIFLIASLFFSYGFIFSHRHPYRYMAIGHALTVINPAVHYVVLYTLFISMIIIGFIFYLAKDNFSTAIRSPQNFFLNLNILILKHRQNKTLMKTPVMKSFVAFLLLGMITLFPYSLFVNLFVLSGIENISESIPVSYYFIKDASVSFIHIISFDLAGIMDQFIEGTYLTAHPRIINIVYSLMLIFPLFSLRIKKMFESNRILQVFYKINFLILAFSVWATLGYSGPDFLPTFHRTIAFVANIANNSQSAIGDLIVQLLGTLMQILRFPHRFQLIFFMLSAIILPLTSLMLEKNYRKLIQQKKGLRKKILYPLFHLLFLLPLLLSWQYRDTFFSGNFLGLLAPYPVHPLKEVKEFLLTLPEGKTIVLPPTESGKRILASDGVEHKFIDKFHIYYLDLPSYYYGLSGDPNNKHEFFLLLRSMYYGQDWWVNISRDNFIKYIVINHELIGNKVGGAEYLPDLEDSIAQQLNSLGDYFRTIFANESYTIYEFIDMPNDERIPIYIDAEWNTFIALQSKHLQLSKYYDLQYGMKPDDLQNYEKLIVLGDDFRHARLDVYAIANPNSFFRPNSNMFPFNQDIISSSYYLAPMFRMFQFFSDSKWNRMEMITPGMYNTISGTFIGLPNPTSFRIDIQLPKNGAYHLLLRATTTANSFNVFSPSLGLNQDWDIMPQDSNAKYFLQENVFTQNRTPYDVSAFSIEDLEELIPRKIVAINYQFQYLDLGVVEASRGPHIITFTKYDENPILVEGILIVPEKDYEELPLRGDVIFIDPQNFACCNEEMLLENLR